MTGSDWEIVGVVAAGLGLVAVPVAYDAWRRFRTARSVVCPGTGGVAGVRIHAVAAAVGAAFDRLPLKVASCSHWPERKGCGQECVDAFRAEPKRPCPPFRVA